MVSYEGQDDTMMVQSHPCFGCGETGAASLHSSSTSTVPCCNADSNDDSLKIAWRYKNLHLPVEFCPMFLSIISS